MNYFILTYEVIIDGGLAEFVTTGSIVTGLDYLPNSTQQKVIEAYHKKYPTSRIATKLFKKEQVSDEQYNEASKTFYVN